MIVYSKGQAEEFRKMKNVSILCVEEEPQQFQSANSSRCIPIFSQNL